MGTMLLTGFVAFCFAGSAMAGPEQDRKQFLQHYQQRFPTLQLGDYANGVYALDADARVSWQAIEEFPPYEIAVENGMQAFNKPFKNGKHYRDCFEQHGLGIAQTYPRWDKASGQVVTLVQAINHCRSANGEPPLPEQKGALVELWAYMAYTSRGKPLAVEVPEDDPRALAAYEQGKRYYFRRRGQLNFSCATCHFQNAGKHIRTELLSPSLGHTSHWPVYRLKWGEIGSLHRRFIGCLEQIRAPLEEPQSEALRNLEYFLSALGDGIPANGPSIRK
ncbi:MAG: sulfur oxidation c-type cytochrome SoxA [Gammaproteobacteria bacterium]